MSDVLNRLYSQKNEIEYIIKNDKIDHKKRLYLIDTLELINKNIGYVLSKECNIFFLKGNDLIDYLNNLLNYRIMYRDTLNIDKEYTFGVEIEYEYFNNDRDVKKFCRDNNIDWYIQRELSVFMGSEICSNIMIDDIANWNNLKKVCNFLKKRGATTINGSAGGHIHIGSHIFENKNNFFNFLKCYLVYEDILNRFFSGEYINIRNCAFEYAPLCRDYYENDLELFFETTILSMGINYLSFRDFSVNNTIEVRRPNGTIEEVIWQNNINVILKMILKIKNNSFDIEYIDYLLNKYNCYDDRNVLYNEINIEKGLEFANIFLDEPLDKLNFLRQYFKGYNLCLDKKELIKAKKYW